MTDLDRLRELADKVQRGEELTMAEQQELRYIAESFIAALQPVIQMLAEMAEMVAKGIMSWWESLPAETRTAIKQSVDEPIKSRRELLQEGLLYGSDSAVGRRVEINLHNGQTVNQYMQNPLNRQVQEIQNEQLSRSREQGIRPAWVPPSWRSPYSR